MKNLLLLFYIILFALLSCSSEKFVQNTIDPAKPYIKIAVSFNTANYPWLMGKKYPTFAIWVEEDKSAAVKTVYITGKAGENKWVGADERPMTVPVWYGVAAKEKVSPDKLKLDAVTGATPGGEVFEISWQVPENLKNKKVRVYLESNISFDYNEFYTKTDDKNSKNFSDVNGQPSLVWVSDIVLNDKSVEVIPEITGHGHVLGSDHDIDRDMSRITTAKDMFNYIKFSYISGK